MKKRLFFALTLALVTTMSVEARMRGVGSGGGSMGGPMHFVIAEDGSVVTVRSTAAAGNGNPSMEVVAVTPAGTEKWKWTATAPVHQFEVTPLHVVVATVSTQTQQSGPSSELIALKLADGTVDWQLTLPGAVMQLDATATMIYALTSMPNGTGNPGGGMGGGNHGGGMGGGNPGGSLMSGARKLLGITHAGGVAWAFDLHN